MTIRGKRQSAFETAGIVLASLLLLEVMVPSVMADDRPSATDQRSAQAEAQATKPEPQKKKRRRGSSSPPPVREELNVPGPSTPSLRPAPLPPSRPVRGDGHSPTVLPEDLTRPGIIRPPPRNDAIAPLPPSMPVPGDGGRTWNPSPMLPRP